MTHTLEDIGKVFEEALSQYDNASKSNWINKDVDVVLENFREACSHMKEAFEVLGVAQGDCVTASKFVKLMYHNWLMECLLAAKASTFKSKSSTLSQSPS